MPGKVKVKIVAGRNLPVMDRSSDTTDAYVEIKLGNITFKTDVCRKSLNPQWNSEWYRFEVCNLLCNSSFSFALLSTLQALLVEKLSNTNAKYTGRVRPHV